LQFPAPKPVRIAALEQLSTRAVQQQYECKGNYNQMWPVLVLTNVCTGRRSLSQQICKMLSSG